MDKDKIILAGKIAVQTIEYARGIVKRDVKLLDIAEKIEAKIVELGGRPAFPVNLSINEIAAHATPSHDDVDTAKGLLKVDIGVHVDGYVADTAFSVDLDNSDLNKKLIASAEDALRSAVKVVKKGAELKDIGKAIDETIVRSGFVCVHNLSGHSIERYDVHAGITIPNYDNGDDTKLDEGLFAVEPFSTNGHGKVRDGKPSGIYHFANEKGIRDSLAREVVKYILSEYNGLPFCSRWIVKKFGSRGLMALRLLEREGIIYQYPQLVESGNGIVAQAEHTFFISKDVLVTTE